MDMKKKAKMKALQEMKGKSKKSRMDEMMDKMPAKKVVVESDSEEGLEEGLSMAKQIMEKREEISGVTVDEPLMGEEYKKKKRK